MRWAALGGQDLTTGEELIVWKSDNLETHFFGEGCLPFFGNRGYEFKEKHLQAEF